MLPCVSGFMTRLRKIFDLFGSCLWGAVRKNIISNRFSTKTAISVRI